MCMDKGSPSIDGAEVHDLQITQKTSRLWRLTGDSLSKPMYRSDRGYWPDQLSRDQRSEIFRCDDECSRERANSAIVM
jgi:hypothetical protein